MPKTLIKFLCGCSPMWAKTCAQGLVFNVSMSCGRWKVSLEGFRDIPTSEWTWKRHSQQKKPRKNRGYWVNNPCVPLELFADYYFQSD